MNEESGNRFRFRVWDEEEKKWSEGLLNNGQGWIGVEWFGNIGSMDRVNAIDESKFTIEQCTGLRDANGRLIYEGDIIKHTVISYSFVKEFETRVSAVIFSENAASWMIEGSSHIAAFNRKIAENSEIIGNIHENPKLLETRR